MNLKINKWNINLIISIFLMFLSTYKNTNIIIFIFICSCLTLCIKPIYIMPLLIISGLLPDLFIIKPGFSIFRALAVILIIVQIIKIIRRKIMKCDYIIICFFIAIISIIASYCSGGKNMDGAISIILYLILFIAIVNFDTYESCKIIKIILVSMVSLTLYYIFYFISNPELFNLTRLTINENVNINSFSKSLSEILIFLIVYIIMKKNTYKDIIIFICIVINSFLLIKTGSRSSLIALVLTIIFILILLAFNSRKISKRKIIYLFIFILVTIFLFNNLKFSDDLINRFSIENIQTNGASGRTDIWNVAMKEIIPNNFLFGIGLGSHNVRFEMLKNGINIGYVHNIILDIIVQVGSLGIVFFAFLYGKLIYRIKKSVKFNRNIIITLAMFICIILIGIGETIFNEPITWIIMSLNVLMIKCKECNDA